MCARDTTRAGCPRIHINAVYARNCTLFPLVHRAAASSVVPDNRPGPSIFSPGVFHGPSDRQVFTVPPGDSSGAKVEFRGKFGGSRAARADGTAACQPEWA